MTKLEQLNSEKIKLTGEIFKIDNAIAEEMKELELIFISKLVQVIGEVRVEVFGSSVKLHRDDKLMADLAYKIKV